MNIYNLKNIKLQNIKLTEFDIDSSKQIAFASANTLIDTTKDKEIQLKELVKKQKNAELACLLITSSEQTKLDEINKKYKINTTTIPFNIRDGIFSCFNASARSFVDENGSFVHLNLGEFLSSEIVIEKNSMQINDSLIKNFENPFLDNELVIHVDYGIGIYEGLEVLKTNTSEEEYIKITK